MTRPDTIRRKLVAVVVLTSVIALVFTGAVLIAHDFLTGRNMSALELTSRAEILAANSTAALAFRNPADATQVLAALSKDPSVIAAAIYDERGERFAIYPPNGLSPIVMRPNATDGPRFEEKFLEVARPVVEGGRTLGTLYLRSDLGALEGRIRMHALVVLLALVGSVGLAFVLASWLQRVVTGPVLVLADAARKVSRLRDYSVRAPVVSEDELGLLTADFNDMLGEIQRRDVAVRSSEARLRAILESALDSIVTMDHEGRIVEFNPAAERMFGYTRETAVGSFLADLLIPEGLRDAHRKGLARYFTTGKSAVLNRRLELSAMKSNGEEFPVELAITRIAQENPALFTGFIRDITERRRAEQEIQELNADLERRVVERTGQLEVSNKELEAFSYSVSHDLRAPLRAIDGFSKALIEDVGDKLDETARRHLERVRNATSQMSHLIDDMLDLARLSRAEMRPQCVALGKIAEEIAGSLKQSQPERNATFVIADDLEVEGDSRLLRVALDNLLRNAWKFTSKHESARIEVGRADRNGSPVYFVADDGAGFDMDHAKLLFAPFQRLHRQNDFEGTGVGLAIVQRIIHRHGGRIWGEGAVERGARFYFTLGEERS